MKNNISSLLFLFLSMQISNAQQKIGYINSITVLEAMPQFKQAQTEIETQKNSYSKALEGMYSDYEAKQKSLQALSSGNATQTVILEAKTQELQDLEKRIQDFESKVNDDLQKLQQDKLKVVNDELLSYVKLASKNNGYSGILDIGSGSVAYYRLESDDITSATMKIMSIPTSSFSQLQSFGQKLGYLNSIEILQAMPEFKQMTLDIEQEKNGYSKTLQGMYSDYDAKQKNLQALSNNKSTPAFFKAYG